LDKFLTISTIDGGGTTEVLSGSLTTESIVQGSLVIGGADSQAMRAVPEPGMICLMIAAFFVLILKRLITTKSSKI
jgi:hypothetical protein